MPDEQHQAFQPVQLFALLDVKPITASEASGRKSFDQQTKRISANPGSGLNSPFLQSHVDQLFAESLASE
jgi:hypothetical protein